MCWPLAFTKWPQVHLHDMVFDLELLEPVVMIIFRKGDRVADCLKIFRKIVVFTAFLAASSARLWSCCGCPQEDQEILIKIGNMIINEARAYDIYTTLETLKREFPDALNILVKVCNNDLLISDLVDSEQERNNVLNILNEMRFYDVNKGQVREDVRALVPVLVKVSAVKTSRVKKTEPEIKIEILTIERAIEKKLITRFLPVQN